VCSFRLCRSIVADPIIYRLVLSPPTYEIRQLHTGRDRTAFPVTWPAVMQMYWNKSLRHQLGRCFIVLGNQWTTLLCLENLTFFTLKLVFMWLHVTIYFCDSAEKASLVIINVQISGSSCSQPWIPWEPRWLFSQKLQKSSRVPWLIFIVNKQTDNLYCEKLIEVSLSCVWPVMIKNWTDAWKTDASLLNFLM